MKSQFYEGMDLAALPTFALVLFVAIFVGTCIRMFVFKRSKDFESLARMPLEEGSHE